MHKQNMKKGKNESKTEEQLKRQTIRQKKERSRRMNGKMGLVRQVQ